MHREVNRTQKGMQTDHVNGNKLDNRRANLRSATPAQNRANRGKTVRNKTGLKGVGTYRNGKYRAVLGKKHLGYFDTPEAAHNAYVEAAKEIHGDFARFN